MIEINNLTKRKIDEKCVKKVVREILKKEKKANLNISIAFIGQERIKELNKRYRGKNKATDVLSFFYKDDGFGEVLICLEKAEMGLCRTLIHGILHILGYDHEKSKSEEKKMADKEEFYLAKLCPVVKFRTPTEAIKKFK